MDYEGFEADFGERTFQLHLNDFSDASVHSESSEPSTGLTNSRSDLDFDYAGVFCPAREVPGNFLEKQSLPSGKIVFAIGDTGLLPDPLPVLCIRHYLRRNLRDRATDPILVAASINQLIYDCCAATCSLSCFYAEYTRDTRILRYVNAGHESPVLVRRNPDEIRRLDEGGPVFGLRDLSEYTEGALTLRNGDRLVAFTQGVIDSLAARSGRSAESALISLTRSRRCSSAFQLANRIVAECEYADFDKRLDKSVFVASLEAAIPSLSSPANAVAVLAQAC